MLVIGICILFRGKSYILDFVMVPIFIYSIVICIERLRISNIFKYLGEHSTNMWLTHSFFCYYYFQEITFMPRFSIIIVLWLIILSLISSFVVDYILKIVETKKNVELKY